MVLGFKIYLQKLVMKSYDGPFMSDNMVVNGTDERYITICYI